MTRNTKNGNRNATELTTYAKTNVNTN